MNTVRLHREATIEELDSAYGVFDAGLNTGDAPQEDLMIGLHTEDNLFATEADAVVYACIRAGQGDEKARDALRRVFGFDAVPAQSVPDTVEQSASEKGTS